MEKLLWKDREETRREVLCAEFRWKDVEFRQGAGEGLVPNTKNSTIGGHSGEVVGLLGRRVSTRAGNGLEVTWPQGADRAGGQGPQGRGPRPTGHGS